jgi:hypothetical protein
VIEYAIAAPIAVVFPRAPLQRTWPLFCFFCDIIWALPVTSLNYMFYVLYVAVFAVLRFNGCIYAWVVPAR